MRRSPHAPEEVQLRAMLRDGRSKAGLTQAQVAKRLGKPQSFVAKYENGERRLDVLEFIRVLKAVGLLQVRGVDGVADIHEPLVPLGESVGGLGMADLEVVPADVAGGEVSVEVREEEHNAGEAVPGGLHLLRQKAARGRIDHQ